MDEVRVETVESVERKVSGLPPGFDVVAWTEAACEASGVPFVVADPVVLGRLRTLITHPA